VARHPVTTFLIMVYAFGWATLISADYVGLPFLLVSSLGVVFGLALPAYLVTVATSGEAGVRDLLGRSLKWRVGVGWYLLAFLGLQFATLLVAFVFLGETPLETLARDWPLFFTMFLPGILVPLVITHLFEEAVAGRGSCRTRSKTGMGPCWPASWWHPLSSCFTFPLVS
jgi:hypothetical protein